jgi:nickel transport protein
MQLDSIGERQEALRKILLITFLVASVLSLLTPWAFAHKVNVFAWVEGDTVHVEGYFAGKKKAQDSLVEVFDSSGEKLLEGRTSEQGEFSFKIPKKTDLEIVLTAGMGHKNDFVIPVSDLGEVSPEPTVESGARTKPEPYEKKLVAAAATSGVDLTQMESIIDKALDRKLTPLIKLIRESRKEGPTLSEVIGGIGYIFGLMGVAMYFMSRKKS